VFIIGSLGNGNSAKVLFESEGVCWNTPTRGEKGQEIAGTLDAKSCASNRGSQANETEFITPAIVSNGDAHSGFGVRRLTPIECERLQGFPDGYTFGQSDSIRYKQLGNAVCVTVAEWIGKRIMEAVND
jgi:DNA (cytosine-5)-methyltransferase 1